MSVMDEALAVTLQVISVLDRLAIPYVVGGSIASSIYGKPRATQDVDVVADVRPEHVQALVAALRSDFYLDEPAIRDAVRRRSTFNVIHLNTLFKVDVFVAKDDVATARELERGRPYVPPQAPGTTITLASAEDTVVQKLYWYRLGDHVSERQWTDAINVLAVRGQELDREYMNDLATHMGVDDLLIRALHQAGFD
ncbi:MAG: hypothetical protein KY467_13765 [Gemmatimonadetes bacterium]|nr:hypothetical protein [Gemmatimonadota bacterium]